MSDEPAYAIGIDAQEVDIERASACDERMLLAADRVLGAHRRERNAAELDGARQQTSGLAHPELGVQIADELDAARQLGGSTVWINRVSAPSNRRQQLSRNALAMGKAARPLLKPAHVSVTDVRERGLQIGPIQIQRPEVP